ncbi:MAG: hypothetical protein LBQ20_06240 [Rhodanobacter sp.]|jgi:hypothetical protein|nr:hypothetical protein [Rhodanobacter sp.]
MKHPLKFDVVMQFLREQQNLIVKKLRTEKEHSEFLEAKRQLDRAIKCLAFCESHQIHPDSDVIQLPWPREAFGEFIVVDTDEMNSKPSWLPVVVNGKTVTLGPGDIVIRLGHGFNLPPIQAPNIAFNPDAFGAG